MTGENPILARVNALRDQWRTFLTSPRERLLHWVIESSEWKMMEALFALEAEDNQTETLFLMPAVNFEDRSQYSLALVDWLVREYAAVVSELEAEGVDVAWTPPVRRFHQSPVAHLIATLSSFCEHHEPLYRTLALVVAPTQIIDTREFLHWLGAAVEQSRGLSVRTVVFDYRERIALGRFAQNNAADVMTIIADLNMAAAYEEISEAAGVSQPSGAFRHSYVQMLNALERDLTEATRLGHAAIAIAEREGWKHLVYSVHYALGSGHLGAKGWADAVEHYRSADQIALALHLDGVDFARGLQVRAQMAIGTALFGAELYEHAATTFEAAAPLAMESKEPIFVMECWRMAAQCYERAHDIKRAWSCAQAALEVGAEMSGKDRAASTLPFVGTQLLELAKHARYRSFASEIDRRMTDLLDEDWRDRATALPIDPDAPHPLATNDANVAAG